MHTDGLVMLGAGEQAPPAAPASAPAPSWTPDPINKTPISGPLQLLGEHKAAAGGGTRRSISSDEAQQQQSQPQEQHDSMEQVSKSASGGRGAAPPEGQQGPDPDLVVSGLKKLDLSSKAKTKNKNNKKKKTADKTNGDKALGNVQLADSSAALQAQPDAAKDIIPPPAPAGPGPGRFTPHKLAGQQRLPAPPPHTSTPPLSAASYIKTAPPASREASAGDLDLAPLTTVTASFIFPKVLPPASTMIFSDLYKSPKSPLSKLRSHPHPVAVPVATVPDLNADLVSKDKARQKEAVKRFLAEKVRTDWDFVWPPVSTSPEASEEAPKAPSSSSSTKDNNINNDNSRPTPTVLEFSQPISIAIAALPSSVDEDAPRDPGEEADSESDAESVYSTVSNDPEHFRPRAEWTSDLSDDERAPHPASPFRFDSPDAVGTIIKTSILKKKSSRRRQVRDEVAWNTGLACFVARRDAWTGAKTVRVKPKPPTPTSPTSPRRLFWRHHRSESGTSHTVASVISGSPPKALPLSPTSTHTSQQTNGAPITPPPSDPESAQTSPLSKGTTATTLQSTSSHESTPAPHTLYPVETLLPVAAPLLPPQNPMRASVTPAIYNSLYDKIVVHSLQPACPVNLADMLRTCVAGWKRDGEWPPRPTVAPMPVPTESMAAIRQRKAAAAAAAAAQHARKGSTATVGSSRRMSLGFLGGSKAEKTQAPPEEKDKDKAAENGSDGSAGKGIRRSLQKVFSLGHGHGDVLITPPA